VWDDGPNKSYDSAAYKTMLEDANRKPGKAERNEGDADKALASAAKVITREYYVPHLAHAPMEPPAATAQLTNGKLEVWAPLQSPGGARGDLATKLGLSEGDVTVHNTLLGGGFGRKSKCDYAIEAALLAKETGGAPVKVVWTREDDIRHGFYHTVTADRFEAGLDANPTRSIRRRSSWGSAWSMRLSTSPTCVSSPGKRRPIPGSAGSARSTTSRMHSASSPSLPRSPKNSAAIPRTFCWS